MAESLWPKPVLCVTSKVKKKMVPKYREDEMSDHNYSKKYVDEDDDAVCYDCVRARDFMFGVADNLDE